MSIVSRVVWSAWILIAALAVAGCSTSPISQAAVDVPARLSITNTTGYSWRIAVISSADEPVHILSLPGYGTSEVFVPAGEYVLEQALLQSSEVISSARRLTIRFVAGDDYEWELATLLAGERSEHDGRSSEKAAPHE